MKSYVRFAVVVGILVATALLVAPANAQTASVIYEDSVLAPWSPNSFRGFYDYANTSQVFRGSAAIFASSSSWGGVSFSTQGIPQATAGQGYLEFSAYSPSSFRIYPILKLGTRMIRSGVNPVLPANQWTTFSIPLSKFIGLASGTIDRVDIMNDGYARTWYVDAVGFTTSASGATSTIAEKVLPTVTVSGIAQGASVSGLVQLTASAADATGISQTQIKVDGVVKGSTPFAPAAFVYAWDTTKLVNGPHTIQATAIDGWGNAASSPPITAWVNNPIAPRPNAQPLSIYTDTVVPPWAASSTRGTVDFQSTERIYRGVASMKLNTLSNGKVMFSTLVPGAVSQHRYLEFAAYSTGTQRIYPMVRVSGKFLSLTSVTTLPNQWKVFSILLPASIATSGAAMDYLELRSDAYSREWFLDEVRLVSTSSLIDIDPPVVSLLSPFSGAVVSGTVVFSASATDNVGVRGVLFKVDGVRVGTEDFIAPYSVVWNSQYAVKGTHSVWAEARDAAGNKTATPIATITVTAVPDLSAPTIPIGLFARAISSTQIDLSWYAARDNIGVVGYRVYQNNDPIVTVTSTRYSNLGLQASTTYTYRVSALDAAGNESVQSAIVTARTLGAPSTSTADRVLPVVGISAPALNASLSGTVAVSATASDNIGVVGVQFQLDGTNLMVEDTSSPYGIFWNTQTVANGIHELKAVARDGAGNRGVSLARSVTVSNTGGGITSTPSGFVSVSGGTFYLDGKPFYFGANNSYWLMDQQGITVEGGGTASQAVLHQLDKSRDSGIKVIRMWGFNDDAARQATLQTSPGVYKETTFKALDFVINEAGKRGLKLIISLVNHQPEYGGIRKYAEWAGLANASEFYTNAQTKQWFKNHISVVLNRTNTYTGVKYKDDPAVMAWEIANEASYEQGGGNADPMILRDFYAEFARYIKSIDANHLVTTGEEGFDHSTYASQYSTYANNWVHRANERGTSYYLNTTIPEIDFAQVHMYPAAWAMQPGQESLRWITEHASIAAAAGKPLIIGEYGISDHAQYNDWLSTVEQTDAVGGAFLWQYGASGVPWYYMQNSGMQIREGDVDEGILIGHNTRMNAKGGVAATSTPDTTAPSVPSGLSATPVSSLQINLSWGASTDNVGVTGYRVYRGGVQIGTVTGTNYQSTGLSAFTAYTYAVAAYDAAGNASTKSATVTASTLSVVAPTSTPTSTLFRSGDRVRATANLNVRATPSVTGTLLGTQAAGALGTVSGGAIASGGYQWWNINYDSGADGWSVENWLALATTTVIVPPASTSTATSSLWVSAYLNSWDLNVPGTTANSGVLTVDQIDWSAFTHAILFATGFKADGTCCVEDQNGDGNLGNDNWQASRFNALTTAGHAKGKPVLFSVGGAGNTAFATMLNAGPAVRTTAVNNLVSFMNKYKFDGIDLDPEAGGSQCPNLPSFVTELRTKLNQQDAYYNASKKPVLTAAILNCYAEWSSVANQIDQINVMSYDLTGTWWGETWHNNAAKNVPGTRVDAWTSCDIADWSEQNGECMNTIEKKINILVKSGIPKAKIGGGVDFNGFLWAGGTNVNGGYPTTPRDRWSVTPVNKGLNSSCGFSGNGETVFSLLKKCYLDPYPSFIKWDSASQVSYFGQNDIYITYQDAQSVRNAVKVIKGAGVGGMILWELGGGYLNTGTFPASQYPGLVRDELLQAVKKEWLGLP